MTGKHSLLGALATEQDTRATDYAAMLERVLTLAEAYNVSSIVFNGWAFLVGKVLDQERASPRVTLASLLTISIFAFLVPAVISQPVLPLLPFVIFFAGTGALAIWIVWGAYHYLMPQVVHYAIFLPSDTEGHEQLLKWFGSVYDRRRQMLWGMAFVAISEGVWGLLEQMIPVFPRDLSVYASLAFAAFFCGQGVYWIAMAPTYLTKLSHVRINLQTLDPAEARPVKDLAHLVFWFVLVCGVTFAGLGVLLYLFVWPYTHSPIPLIVFYVLVIGLITYFFVKANLDLARIIGMQKQRILDDIQKRITEIYDNPFLTKDDLESIEGLWTLYDRVRSTKNSALSVGMFQSLSGSILLQTLPFIIQLAGDLAAGGSVLESLGNMVR